MLTLRANSVLKASPESLSERSAIEVSKAKPNLFISRQISGCVKPSLPSFSDKVFCIVSCAVSLASLKPFKDLIGPALATLINISVTLDSVARGR